MRRSHRRGRFRAIGRDRRFGDGLFPVEVLGAIYLVYVGVSLIRASRSSPKRRRRQRWPTPTARDIPQGF
jgi:hypothetical protein